MPRGEKVTAGLRTFSEAMVSRNSSSVTRRKSPLRTDGFHAVGGGRPPVAFEVVVPLATLPHPMLRASLGFQRCMTASALR